MSKEVHFEKLERMYLGANINTRIFKTTTIDISKGNAVVGLEISEDYFHALDALHGSVYFKLLDDAAFFAVSSVVEDVFVLTASFQVELLKPVASGKLRSEGTVIREEGRKFIAESILYNDQETEIARGTGIFVKSRSPLDPGIGYK